MKNYKMIIAYDGSRYYGWEHQPNLELTIQGKIESILQIMCPDQKNLEVLGAGRTDAGVHAIGMCAHVHLDTDKSPKEIRTYMNHYLPDDISILSLEEVNDRFHSRYNAQGKTYCYSIWQGAQKPLFSRKYVCELEEGDPPLDQELMKKAAAHLMGTHDFASFCGNAKMKKSTVRTVDQIDIRMDGEILRLTYHGNGFLQYMVRILSGTLIEVGLGKRDPDSMPALLECKKRADAGYTAPAKGLCLIKVDY